jgi:hypothetical protein
MPHRIRWPFGLGLIGLLFACALPVRADLPSGLKGQDLGAPSISGSFTTDASKGTLTIVAGGSDIWGAADEGYFVYVPATANVSITGRFTSRTGGHTDNAAKSGPDLRATADPDAASAFLPFQGERFIDPHFRFNTGDQTTNFEIEDRGHPPSATTPLWQRVERQGNRVSGLISDDGKVWNSLVSVTMDNMPAQALAGFGATAHGGDTALTAVYDNVSIGTDLSPQNVVALAQDKGAMVMWDAVPGADGYNVYSQAADRSTTLVTTTPTKNTSAQIQNLENGKAATLIVTAVQGGKEGIGVETVVTPAAPIAGTLQGVNINTIVPGTASADAAGVITLTGGGYAIGVDQTGAGGNSGRSDGFYFLAMPHAGDVTITARVMAGPDSSDTNRDDAGRQAAVIIRESLDQDSRFVMMDLTSGGGAELQARTKASDVAAVTDAGLSDPSLRPVWLRVVRKGNTFTGFISEDKDGKTFKQAGDPVTIDGFSSQAYMGLGVNPRTGFGAYYPAALPNPTETAKAQFDNLTVQ